MIKVLRKIMSIMLVFSMTISLTITSYAEETSSENVVIESTTMGEYIDVIESTTKANEFEASEESVEDETEPEEESIETTTQIDFIEETSSGQSINDYEKEALDKINEIIESSELESDEMSEEESSNILESALDDV